MARKRQGAEAPKRQIKRLSIRMDVETIRRLKALALASQRTENQVMLDALAPLLATVRIPWIVRTGEAERTEDAA